VKEWLWAAREKGFAFFKIREKLKKDNFVASSEVAMLERNWYTQNVL